MIRTYSLPHSLELTHFFFGRSLLDESFPNWLLESEPMADCSENPTQNNWRSYETSPNCPNSSIGKLEKDITPKIYSNMDQKVDRGVLPAIGAEKILSEELARRDGDLKMPKEKAIQWSRLINFFTTPIYVRFKRNFLQ